MSDIPYSEEAEISILGNFVYDPELFAKHGKELSPDDFFAPGSRNIFGVLCRIVDRGEVVRLETITPLIEKEDFGTLADAIAKCRKSESDFAADLRTVLRDSARRRRLADLTIEQERILADPNFELPKVGQAKWVSDLGRAVLTPTAIGKLNLPKRQPILGTWFLEGDLGFIYGPRGLGKTWLAMLIARAISEGRAIGPWQATEARRVIYVDGEMAVDASIERAEQLAQGTGDNFFLLHHESLFALTGRVLNLTSPEAQAALMCANRWKTSTTTG